MKKALFYALVVSGLSACGGNVKTMESLACNGVNWKKVGYEAVANNQPVRYFDKYKNACGDKLEEGAIKLYQDGYAEAAVEFCTYENGYTYGSTGKKEPVVCLFELKDEFMEGYKVGKFERNEKLSELKRISDQQNEADLDARPMNPDNN